jgi:acyl-CoA synthetase (AMP-forming)/AMP-acid ligase II
LLIDLEGWATVGDRGELSGSHLRVHGRGAAAVTTGGATVLTADVERILRPAARGEVHVLGLPHPDLGQVLVAALTDPDDLEPVRARSRIDLPASHRPRLWFHVENVPLTSVGKVDVESLSRLLASAEADRMRLAR